MKEPFAFHLRETAFSRAAAEGARAAAEVLAEALAAEGYPARISAQPDGTAVVSLEGASALAREFGTLTRTPMPIMGPAVIERRTRMVEAMATAIARGLKDGRS